VFPIGGENVVESTWVIPFLLELGEVDHRSIHGVSVWILASNPGVGVGVARSTDEDHVTAFHGSILPFLREVLHRERMVGVAPLRKTS